MWLNFKFLTIISSVSLALSNWHMYWNDEFNGNKIDPAKWKVKNEAGSCEGHFLFYVINAFI